LLENLKNKKLIYKYGLSAYELDDVEYACKNFNFKIFQIPINIFNLSGNELKKIFNLKSKYELELHGRSLFLQGLMTNKDKRLPRKFNKIETNRDLLLKEAKLNNLNPSHLIMNKVDDLNVIDVAIIGLENIQNYREIITYKKKKLKKNNTNYYINDKTITDPRRW
jgi:aryl-alcohol dehydrogenase-like predicted oxidoreductase